MKKIPLPHGAVALVDDADYGRLTAHHWWLNGGGYAYTQIGRRTVYMHRLIMDAPPGMLVDHIDGDRLNNQRHNLRFATNGQNLQNVKRARRDSQTGIRGVFPRRGKFTARIWINGRSIQLGTYSTLREAEGAVKEGRRRYMTHAPESEVQ